MDWVRWPARSVDFFVWCHRKELICSMHYLVVKLRTADADFYDRFKLVFHNTWQLQVRYFEYTLPSSHVLCTVNRPSARMCYSVSQTVMVFESNTLVNTWLPPTGSIVFQPSHIHVTTSFCATETTQTVVPFDGMFQGI